MNKYFKKGFTLIELTIVVVIMAILVVIVLPFFNEGYDRSKEKTDLINLKTLNTAMDLYIISNNNLVIDDDVTEEELMEILIDEGYIEKPIEPVFEGALFKWNSENHRWIYQKP